MIIKDQDVKAGKQIAGVDHKSQKKMSVLALEKTTAKLPGALVVTSSGYGYLSFGAYSATGATKLAIPLDAVSSGSYLDCVVDGYVPGVSISGTGAASTAYSTFTVGHWVYLSDTGHMVDGGASWVDACNGFSSAQTTAASAIGIALSSGETTSVDLMIIEKPYVHAASSA